MNKSCSHCNGTVGPLALALKCHSCADMYHCECLNITEQQFSGYTRDQKAAWKCHPCSNITQRSRPESASLNCPTHPENCEDAINMSCDNLEQQLWSPNSSLSSTSTIVAGAASNSTDSGTLGIITQELNKTLTGWRTDMDHAMAKFTADIKTSLRGWREEMEISMTKFNDSIQCSITEMKQEMNSLRSAHQSLNERVSTVALDVSELKSSVQFQAAEHKDLQERVEIISRHSSDHSQSLIRNLELKIDSLEQQARNCNIEICNVPERRGEDLIHMMEQLGTAIKFPIQRKDIISIHRVQHAQQTSNRPKNIIVKFCTRITRDNVLSAYRLAKELKSDQIGISGSSIRIYLNEHLTLKTKQLFRDCKEAAKQHDFKYVWVKNSTILVRERDGLASFAVRTLEDVRKIKSGDKIPSAPRFYEVVKYPMCLHDISTKLKNSSYNEYEQVVQDFRRIFNNVRLYLKSCPDPTMKKNVNKISNDFEKMLNEEFQTKWESKSKAQDVVESQNNTNKKDEKDSDNNAEAKHEDIKKNDPKTSADDKK